MQKECDISVKASDAIIKIEIIGALTASAEDEMDKVIQKTSTCKADKILVVFDGSSRINSAGIAIMINLVIKSQENDRKVFIMGVSKHFRKIFELVGLTRYATIVNSEDEIK
jgi:anti-anti-sigma factor